jgi:hypothetical protein
MWRVVIQNHVWAMQIWDGDDPGVAAQLAREANQMFRVKDCEIVVQTLTPSRRWMDIRDLQRVAIVTDE